MQEAVPERTTSNMTADECDDANGASLGNLANNRDLVFFEANNSNLSFTFRRSVRFASPWCPGGQKGSVRPAASWGQRCSVRLAMVSWSSRAGGRRT